MAKKRAAKRAQMKVTTHELSEVEIEDLERLVGSGPACGPGHGPLPSKGNQGSGGLPDWAKYVGGAAAGRYLGKAFDWAEKQLVNVFKGGGGEGGACGEK